MGMLYHFIITICAFISNLFHALWRALLVSEAAGLVARNASVGESMEGLSPRQLALKQLKQRFLEALQANDAQEVLHILHSTNLDIDTVLEVEDPSMVLASYKQGKKELSKHNQQLLVSYQLLCVVILY